MTVTPYHYAKFFCSFSCRLSVSFCISIACLRFFCLRKILMVMEKLVMMEVRALVLSQRCGPRWITSQALSEWISKRGVQIKTMLDLDIKNAREHRGSFLLLYATFEYVVQCNTMAYFGLNHLQTLERTIPMAVDGFLVASLKRIWKHIFCDDYKQFFHFERIKAPRLLLLYLSETCSKMQTDQKFQERIWDDWCRCYPVCQDRKRFIIVRLQGIFWGYVLLFQGVSRD